MSRATDVLFRVNPLLCINPEKPIAALFRDAGAIEAYLAGKRLRKPRNQVLQGKD